MSKKKQTAFPPKKRTRKTWYARVRIIKVPPVHPLQQCEQDIQDRPEREFPVLSEGEEA